jgi:hypothetical protein
LLRCGVPWVRKSSRFAATGGSCIGRTPPAAGCRFGRRSPLAGPVAARRSGSVTGRRSGSVAGRRSPVRSPLAGPVRSPLAGPVRSPVAARRSGRRSPLAGPVAGGRSPARNRLNDTRASTARQIGNVARQTLPARILMSSGRPGVPAQIIKIRCDVGILRRFQSDKTEMSPGRTPATRILMSSGPPCLRKSSRFRARVSRPGHRRALSPRSLPRVRGEPVSVKGESICRDCEAGRATEGVLDVLAGLARRGDLWEVLTDVNVWRDTSDIDGERFPRALYPLESP